MFWLWRQRQPPSTPPTTRAEVEEARRRLIEKANYIEQLDILSAEEKAAASQEARQRFVEIVARYMKL